MDLHHDTGKAKYLTDPLLAGFPEYYQAIADHVLEDGPVAGMKDAVEKLADESSRQAPKELSLLSRSDHPTVTDDGAVVYDRPPEVPRLSDDELYLLHNGKPNLHGAGRRGRVEGAPGKFAINNPNSSGDARPDPRGPAGSRRTDDR